MYVRQRSWIDCGPGLGLVASRGPAIRTSSPRPARAARVIAVPRSRGVGEYPGDPCYDAAFRSTWLGSLLPYWISSGNEMACVLSSGAAGLYEKAQYGYIPRPADLPLPPSAVAPQTAEQLGGAWSPEDVAAGAPERWEAWKAAQRARIAEFEASGEYNPRGNLPVTALELSDFFSKYGTALALAGVALVGVVAVTAVRR